MFEGLHDAKTLAAKWRHEYNHHRPHSSLKYLPPALYAAQLTGTQAGPPVGAASSPSAPILTHRLS
jgi:transposase InsO family protein